MRKPLLVAWVLLLGHCVVLDTLIYWKLDDLNQRYDRAVSILSGKVSDDANAFWDSQKKEVGRLAKQSQWAWCLAHNHPANCSPP